MEKANLYRFNKFLIIFREDVNLFKGMFLLTCFWFILCPLFKEHTQNLMSDEPPSYVVAAEKLSGFLQAAFFLPALSLYKECLC